MNVEMPDGTIIADVPEGITRSELLRRYKAMSAPAPAPVETPEPEDPGALMAGVIGAGRFSDRILKGAKPSSRRRALTQRSMGVWKSILTTWAR